MNDTKIEWCGKTGGFDTGCELFSPGCKFCYAKKQSKRLQQQQLGIATKAAANQLATPNFDQLPAHVQESVIALTK